MNAASLPKAPHLRRRRTVVPASPAASKLAWLRSFLEMVEAGDALIGATPKSLALCQDLRCQIAALEHTSASAPRPAPQARRG